MKSPLTLLSISVLSCYSLIPTLTAPASPPEDGIWYYEIGGAKPVSAAANPKVTSVTVGANAALNLGYSCLKFDPLVAVRETLNQVRSGGEDMLNAMTQAATGALASLPAMILQRANPGLYDLFQNALVRAELTVDVATKTCEQIEASIGNNKNPYEDLIVLSKGNDWKVQMGVRGGNIVKAKKSVELSNGANGVPWIGGSAGGMNQDPIELTSDVASAGFNLQMNRPPSASGTVAVDPSSRLTQVWNSPAIAAEWIVDVVGEHKVSTCEGCDKSTQPGNGLGRSLEQEEDSVQQVLEALIKDSNPPKLNELAQVSAPSIAITRDVVESIRDLESTEKQIVVDRLVSEIAVARTIERALLARRLLKSGSHLPEVHANSVAREHTDKIIEDLDAEVERLIFESRLRKEMVSSTVVNLLTRDEAKKRSSLSVPETNRRDPDPFWDGHVPAP